MSLDILRRDAVSGKQNDLTDVIGRLSSQKRALRSVTNLISKNANLSNLVNSIHDIENSPPPDSEELSWLNSHDISNGHYFDDTSIPFPPISQDDDSIYVSKPNRGSAQPSDQPQTSSSTDAFASDGSATSTLDPASSSQSMTASTTQQTIPVLPGDDDEGTVPATYSQEALQQPDGPVALPGKIAPPQPEEEADFSGITQQLLDLDSPERPAKVVHLPPEDVQEEQRREVESERRMHSEDAEQAKVSRSQSHAQAEPASSPSSTAGAYSAATPMPPQDSPDTSPDSETGEQIEVLPPKDLRPSPEERREKEEHDRLLAAQKELAKRQAMGDVSTPDGQLKWEEREAAARNAEEQAAREDVNGPEADGKDATEETQAEEVVDDVEQDKEEQAEAATNGEDMEVVAEPSTVDESSQQSQAQEDGDNITVTPRNKLPLTIDTTRLQQSTTDMNGQPTPAEQERMTTRTSSGVLHKRTVSELLGQTPTSASRLGNMSPEATSPMTARHPHDAAARPSNTAHQTPRRPPRPIGIPRTPSNTQSALDELMALKGAAEDADRDYLEPLFRIQAHDSPNVRTTSLPDLVRSAHKTLSTEDHFTTIHERLDYRILRRIYQLQNANKWSLRQMDKCREPEQPVTHHDHMMAEMQWMRKDFKAERKMRKSVCAWLAQRCADWVAASAEERQRMQIKAQPPKPRTKQDHDDSEYPPELEQSSESAPEDDAGPPTPTGEAIVPSMLIVSSHLSEAVSDLQKAGKLGKALEALPVDGLTDMASKVHKVSSLNAVSKFAEGRVLPKTSGTKRKRSRYDYEDDAEVLDSERERKRLREERSLPPEDQESALFHPENKHIRDRLHANNAFRPPSEFIMPSTSFYEFRNGSQWIWEDDQKLRKLAKEYSFNWSLIAEELQLPSGFKSSAERRTPWECFERWVELEQLPTEMKKTMYFKTWYQRLEQSQQAAERRYQAQVAALQAQSNNQVNHVPMRRRTIPTRVEKRKNTRYLWLVDAVRKLARKKEQQAYKAAEAQRAAAGRKTNDNNNNQNRQPMLTPQEFSKKRHERDLQVQEQNRKARQHMLEQHQRQLAIARQQASQQQGAQNGNANQQRPGSSSNVSATQAQMQANVPPQPSLNPPMPSQARPQIPMATRNGHLAVPQVNGQGVPQAQMRPNEQMPNPQEMQRMAQANAQRSAQYGGQQQYQMANANMSPGSGGMTPQQQLQSSQAMLSNMQQQMNNSTHQGSQTTSHQMSASPNMPPPPTPQGHPQQLSSGHVPALLTIKSQLRQRFPQSTDEQVNAMATDMLTKQSQSQSTNQARQNAMNAAAGINGGVAQSHSGNMQAYAHNQAAFQNNQNGQMANGNNFMSGDGSQQPNMSPQQYNTYMRQRMMQQQSRMQGSPGTNHATLNGSPSLAHASPSMAPVSPNMQYSNMNQMAGMNMAAMNTQQQRPSSRSETPQMQRMRSSGSVPTMNGMPSPQGVNGMQGSPMQANMAR